MDPRDFIESPWTQASLHAAYEQSFLHMRPAPEYASGEVVLASTYRRVGLEAGIVSEGKVPSLGREFQKLLDKGKRPEGRESTIGIDADAWSRIVSGTLRSPKQPNQSSKRFLQISPVVPDAAIYSLSARLSANSWNPGELVAAVVQYGSKSRDNAQVLWHELFNALSVDEDDDIWARFLDAEFRSWRSKLLVDAWQSPRALQTEPRFEAWHEASMRVPASQFVEEEASHETAVDQHARGIAPYRDRVPCPLGLQGECGVSRPCTQGPAGLGATPGPRICQGADLNRNRILALRPVRLGDASHERHRLREGPGRLEPAASPARVSVWAR
ncbi:MAG TPA: hypothetical protein EYO33_28315 [Phycisphaerales bacterium]|nr:hypothetical protein [Phycisphaerales bacterium]